MVYRIFVEKKKEFAHEAKQLLNDCNKLLSIENLTGVRVINMYDVENIEKEVFDYAKKTVFAEMQTDVFYEEIKTDSDKVFAVEYLPGQYDQRADSASQCIQLISQSQRPTVKSAKVYVLSGELTDEDVEEIKKYVINPVESRQASLEKPEKLDTDFEIPTEVQILTGFNELTRIELSNLVKKLSLAMDDDDAAFCQEYFRSEKRDPTITEIRMIDTYWSDHCRHTTFLTNIDDVFFEDELLEKTYKEYMLVKEKRGSNKKVCLMDIATAAVKYLKKNGMLDKLDESEEINACTVKVDVNIDGKKEPWLLLFKNETHNHPTEIEPFGGAATCIGGAIRDPLSGRSYVYAAMRVTGAADPLKSIRETIPGKLPQRKIVTTAANGYSSYGNQIGLATGIVDELYHPGYAAKRMEIGAVVAAAPAENVRRERPKDSDVVILLGGCTGRDGIGGATGSSKAHDSHSVETCGAEVQKGNAPEERKLQRLFRRYDACRMIKRCNDFGAGGVSVAIGELADGLEIFLDKVPKKYEGLDATELAISESQERMAVVVEKDDVDAFLKIANEENLRATPVAVVKDEPRLKMFWNNCTVVDISREFLNSNGAEKHVNVICEKYKKFEKDIGSSFTDNYKNLASDLNVCSKRGLSERFDSTIGAGTVLMPFGGKNQLTPIQAMVHLVSSEKKHTDTCSLMSWGYNPFITEKSPYHGAYLAVIESICKIVASGAKFEDVYLTFQEYFEKLGSDAKRWGKPMSALLGAFRAQMDLSVASIGGKDSMSGSFEKLDVPPTLVSFAVTTEKLDNIISPEFKKGNSNVYLIKNNTDKNLLFDAKKLINSFERIHCLIESKKALSVYTPTYGGIAEAIMKMCFGNGFGFKYDDAVSNEDIFSYCYGSFIVETDEKIEDAILLGKTTNDNAITFRGETVFLDELLKLYEGKLESVFSCNIEQKTDEMRTVSYNLAKKQYASIKTAKPKVFIPVFPGTNCEYDSAKAFEDAGAQAIVKVINNITPESIKRSIDECAKAINESQMVFIPGGFSAGDEPDGSGKFITAFFRNEKMKNAVMNLLENRDGLMSGICNGFQALIKLGLVPYGEIIDTDENCPTLTFNTIARHQSRIVRTRIASNKSPWLQMMNVGDIINVPISHGEGRFIADDETISVLEKNGQIATQYVDFSNEATSEISFNPNNSRLAVEGITSPDGRVFGKMGHSERIGRGLYKNVPGRYDIKMFESAVKYFK